MFGTVRHWFFRHGSDRLFALNKFGAATRDGERGFRGELRPRHFPPSGEGFEEAPIPPADQRITH